MEEEAAKAKARQEARKNQQNMPYRFRVPVGETRQVVVLDAAPDFFQYEHTLKGPEGFWNVHTGCIKEHDACPVCEASGKDSTYCMYLSVLDLTPYTNRNGEEVPFSRKLFVVKNQQQKKIMRMFQREGTLRGAILNCTRDGEKEPQIGNDIELDNWMEEADLATYQREWVDRENKVHVEDCSQPYDYEALFQEPTAESLRALVGGRPTPGSTAANREALSRPAARRDRDDWEDADAQGTYEDEAAAPPRRAAPAPARRAPAAAAPARTAARPAPVARRAAPAPVVEEEQQAEGEEYVEGEEVVEGEEYVEGAAVEGEEYVEGEEAAGAEGGEYVEEEAAPAPAPRRALPAARPAARPAPAPVRRGPPVAARPAAAPVRRAAPAPAEPAGNPRRVAVRRPMPQR